MIEMVKAHGYWWPAGSEGYCIRYVNRSKDMESALKRCKGQSVAVQAGGHCGVWPIWLAFPFRNVYTFEPDPKNFACLSRNVANDIVGERIFAARGMLADGRAPLSISTNKVNIGGHKGKQEPGNIPIYRIDDMRLHACDLIVLDVEGMEVPALMGAVHTIEKFHPVIMVEDNESGDRYGWGGRDRLHSLLETLNYEIVERPYKSKDIICEWRSAS